MYAANPSSTRATSDQIRRYIRGGAAWRQEVTSSSKDYFKDRLTPSSAMLTWIHTRISQFISSWIVGKRKIRTSMASTSTCKGKNSIFLLIGWHVREGGSSHYLKFDSTHGGKTWGTHFTHTWIGQRLGRNIGREVVLPHYPQISPSQSTVGQGYILVFGIRPWLGAINFAPK